MTPGRSATRGACVSPTRYAVPCDLSGPGSLSKSECVCRYGAHLTEGGLEALSSLIVKECLAAVDSLHVPGCLWCAGALKYIGLFMHFGSLFLNGLLLDAGTLLECG